MTGCCAGRFAMETGSGGCCWHAETKTSPSATAMDRLKNNGIRGRMVLAHSEDESTMNETECARPRARKCRTMTHRPPRRAPGRPAHDGRPPGRKMGREQS